MLMTIALMQAIIINLSLAVFWLFFGGAILVAEHVNGPFAYQPLGISLGWWCLLLSLFNWVRVLTTWAGQRRRRKAPVEPQPLSSLAERKPPRPQQPIDPNFQFTEKPPDSNSQSEDPATPTSINEVAISRSSSRKWQSSGGAIGLILGTGFSLARNWQQISDNPGEVLGATIFFALLFAIIGAIIGFILDKIIRNPAVETKQDEG
jgi:hypothetical protein